MKIPKIFSPELEVEFVGIKGFLIALVTIFKLKGGIKRAHIDCQIKTLTAQSHGVDGGIVKRCYFWVVPKFKFKRVAEINEKEQQ